MPASIHGWIELLGNVSLTFAALPAVELPLVLFLALALVVVVLLAFLVVVTVVFLAVVLVDAAFVADEDDDEVPAGAVKLLAAPGVGLVVHCQPLSPCAHAWPSAAAP